MASIGWTSIVGEAMGAHVYTFKAQETQGVVMQPPPELLARVYCHAMVSALPKEALPELVDDLHDLRSHYSRVGRQAWQLPTPASKVTAKVGKALPKPEIQLDEG
jgi:hypothetical protein